MNTKHTPGPWHYAASDLTPGRYSIYHNGPIAYCGDTTAAPDDGLANARLISAAPDLLAALQMVSRIWSSDQTANVDPDSPLAVVRAALAKAGA